MIHIAPSFNEHLDSIEEDLLLHFRRIIKRVTRFLSIIFNNSIISIFRTRVIFDGRILFDLQNNISKRESNQLTSSEVENARLRITVPLPLELPYIRSRKMVCSRPGAESSIVFSNQRLNFSNAQAKVLRNVILLAFSRQKANIQHSGGALKIN